MTDANFKVKSQELEDKSTVHDVVVCNAHGEEIVLLHAASEVHAQEAARALQLVLDQFGGTGSDCAVRGLATELQKITDHYQSRTCGMPAAM